MRYFPQLDDPLFLVSCPAPPAAAQPVQLHWSGDQKHVSVIDRAHGGWGWLSREEAHCCTAGLRAGGSNSVHALSPQ